ncbi:BlaI/MecI/CopY family transcriptional regulator [Candidatus Gracilibacteria bacterium]|nr:BlaI/MecI/CopY family transcriptional regulator [Candidatus Gracilibacteria bacterium]
MLLHKKLLTIGFNEKEAHVYAALLEFGTQPASVIAKKVSYPKATVLFLFDRLVKRGYVRKSQRGRVQYFFAVPEDLETAQKQTLKTHQDALDTVMPLLKELKHPLTSQPKVTFFEGINGCRKAYNLLLESKTEILEFGVHDDLLKLGSAYMKNFIKERSKRKIFIKAVAPRTKIHQQLIKHNIKERRKIFLYPEKAGRLYSSIAIFDDKVLLLNLYQDAFAILIENTEVAQTLRTIHALVFH